MYYEFEITVKTDDTKDKPSKLKCPLVYGILRKVTLQFPAGVHRVTKIAIYRWERQIFPTNPENIITADDFTVSFEEYLPIIETPFNVVVYGWNDGGSYEHTIRCGFTILPVKVTQIYPTTLVEEKELAELLGEYEMVGEQHE
ncbi:hypothetical protein ES705_32801 [subsurface metagenome]